MSQKDPKRSNVHSPASSTAGRPPSRADSVSSATSNATRRPSKPLPVPPAPPLSPLPSKKTDRNVSSPSSVSLPSTASKGRHFPDGSKSEKNSGPTSPNPSYTIGEKVAHETQVANQILRRPSKNGGVKAIKEGSRPGVSHRIETKGLDEQDSIDIGRQSSPLSSGGLKGRRAAGPRSPRSPQVHDELPSIILARVTAASNFGPNAKARSDDEEEYDFSDTMSGSTQVKGEGLQATPGRSSGAVRGNPSFASDSNEKQTIQTRPQKNTVEARDALMGLLMKGPQAEDRPPLPPASVATPFHTALSSNASKETGDIWNRMSIPALYASNGTGFFSRRPSSEGGIAANVSQEVSTANPPSPVAGSLSLTALFSSAAQTPKVESNSLNHESSSADATAMSVKQKQQVLLSALFGGASASASGGAEQQKTVDPSFLSNTPGGAFGAGISKALQGYPASHEPPTQTLDSLSLQDRPPASVTELFSRASSVHNLPPQPVAPAVSFMGGGGGSGGGGGGGGGGMGSFAMFQQQISQQQSFADLNKQDMSANLKAMMGIGASPPKVQFQAGKPEQGDSTKQQILLNALLGPK
ncbi:hypothetical protein HDU67_009304 [Dinochytrium kinnereticum]|nr:hypothetical protein HDU67_009304 [Dinochytrium kinnereticum]